MTNRRFEGVYPVLYAFFDRDGRLDHDAMRVQVEHCLEAGAHGITVLGLVTEVHKMSEGERREVVEVVGVAVGGRVPYAVTVGEPTPEGQITFARAAKASGADWVILQPPPGRGHDEDDLKRHFGKIADALDLPVAVQNNPVNLDSYLTPQGLADVVKAHPNITLLKGEGWSVDIAYVLDALNGEVGVFGGHGGLEFLSLLRSGGAGLIPAPDCLAVQVEIFEAFRSRDPRRLARAEELHRRILPLVVFMTRSVPGLLVYGKRVMARRLGLPPPLDRAPTGTPTPFGVSEMERLLGDVLAAERDLLSPWQNAQIP